MEQTGTESKASFSPCPFQNCPRLSPEERHYLQLTGDCEVSQTKGSGSGIDNPISTQFGLNSDEPTWIKYQNSGFLMWFYARLESVAEEKSRYTINTKSFNYLKSIGRLIFTENRCLTSILQKHANDSHVAKSFWIVYYSVLCCSRNKEKGFRVRSGKYYICQLASMANVPAQPRN